MAQTAAGVAVRQSHRRRSAPVAGSAKPDETDYAWYCEHCDGVMQPTDTHCPTCHAPIAWGQGDDAPAPLLSPDDVFFRYAGMGGAYAIYRSRVASARGAQITTIPIGHISSCAVVGFGGTKLRLNTTDGRHHDYTLGEHVPAAHAALVSLLTSPPSRSGLPTTPAPPTVIPVSPWTRKTKVSLGIIALVLLYFVFAPKTPPPSSSYPSSTTNSSYVAPINNNNSNTAEETAYRSGVARTTGEFSTFLGKLTVELNTPDVTDVDWKLRMVTIMAGMQVAADDVLTLQAPPRFYAMDMQYKAGARHYKTSMQLLAQGIDQASPAVLRQAGTELQQGTQAVEAAKALLP